MIIIDKPSAWTSQAVGAVSEPEMADSAEFKSLLNEETDRQEKPEDGSTAYAAAVPVQNTTVASKSLTGVSEPDKQAVFSAIGSAGVDIPASLASFAPDETGPSDALLQAPEPGTDPGFGLTVGMDDSVENGLGAVPSGNLESLDFQQPLVAHLMSSHPSEQRNAPSNVKGATLPPSLPLAPEDAGILTGLLDAAVAKLGDSANDPASSGSAIKDSNPAVVALLPASVAPALTVLSAEGAMRLAMATPKTKGNDAVLMAQMGEGVTPSSLPQPVSQHPSLMVGAAPMPVEIWVIAPNTVAEDTLSGGLPNEEGAEIAGLVRGFADSPRLIAQALPLPQSATAFWGIPKLVAQQIATGTGRAVEMVLSSDDLGVLKIEMTSDGDSIRMVLMADRTDTLDLMRRHLDQLRSELASAGFNNADLCFGSWNERGYAGNPAKSGSNIGESYGREIVELSVPAVAYAHKQTGLDLRF